MEPIIAMWIKPSRKETRWGKRTAWEKIYIFSNKLSDHMTETKTIKDNGKDKDKFTEIFNKF